MFNSVKEVSTDILWGVLAAIAVVAAFLFGVAVFLGALLFIAALQAGLGAIVGLGLSWLFPAAQVWMVATTGFGLPTAGAIASVIAGMFRRVATTNG